MGKHENQLLVGKSFQSNNCGEFTILAYNCYQNVLIRFTATGYERTYWLKEILNGKVNDPLHKSMCGVGFIGIGEYSPREDVNGKRKLSRAYIAWANRIQSCYGIKRKSYEDCTVCDEWHNFQNFAKWYKEQEMRYGTEGEVDKDLLFLGNRYYSPDTCCYVPTKINNLFVGSRVKRGYSLEKKEGKYCVRLCLGRNKTEHLGTFTCETSAKNAYKEAKAKHVMATCLSCQDLMDERLFYKMYTGALNYVNYYYHWRTNNDNPK